MTIKAPRTATSWPAAVCRDVVIAGSLLLTNLSAEQLVGSNGQTWLVGMSPMAFEVLAATALHRAGAVCRTALPEKRHHHHPAAASACALIEAPNCGSVHRCTSCCALVVQIPVVLYSGSLVFENIFGLSGILGVTKFQAIVILCIAISVIGSIYAIFGGLKAVAVSDTVNGVGLLIGGLAVPFLALNVLGHTANGGGIIEGMRYLIENHSDMLNSIAPAEIFCTGCSVADRIYGHGHSGPAVVVHQSGVCTARTRRKEPEGSTEGCSAAAQR